MLEETKETKDCYMSMAVNEGSFNRIYTVHRDSQRWFKNACILGLGVRTSWKEDSSRVPR
jgi:hypothetical protein